MITLPFIGFLGFIFVGMTAANRILEGVFITTNDVSILNQLTIFRDMSVFGLFTMPVPNLEFLTGVFHLVKMDYSYFGGNAAFLQFFLYSITGAMAFALFITVLSILSFYLTRTR